VSIWQIVAKSLRQHALATVLTSLSMALAAGLLFSVWVIRDQVHAALTQTTGGFDAVLGARSSKLQLVLNAIFHLEASPANIEWRDYEEISRHPGIEFAAPIAMGDNYRGFRVVGTLPDFFARTEFAPGRKYQVRPGGRMFDPALREAVAGSFAAQKLKLTPGVRFRPYHGLNFDPNQQHQEEYVVVGILEPSNTPADRVIWIPLEGVQKMGGHSEKAAAEVSAVLLKLRTPVVGRNLDMLYNKEGSRLTFAWPIGATVAELLNRFDWVEIVMRQLTYLIAIISGLSILATMYNSMSARRRQIAIMRALGARRLTVFRSIVFEAVGIGAIGIIVGTLIYFVITSVAANVVRNQTGMVLSPLSWHPIFCFGALGLLVLSAVAGIVPAVQAYRTDVAAGLAPEG
jgi:putative ABC transport system permease protein